MNGQQTARPDPGPRDDGREQQFRRVRLRDPSEKYNITKSEMQRGMDYFWAATDIRGMKNPRFGDYYRAGWRPVAAEAFPELSGLDIQADPALVALGIIPEVKKDGPIIRDGLMLMTRPIQMSAESEARLKKDASDQLENHLRTVRGRSERQIGRERTRVSRNYGPPDEAPSDQEVEMG